MGNSPAIYGGSRTKILTSKGLLLKDGTTIDYDGAINYITRNDGLSITGWATYADAAGASPVDGTGGSANVTFATSTNSDIRGTTNFLFTHDAANRQGQGFSYNFTIDKADQAKMLTVSFEYLVASGTYADGDLTVWIYDVTNATLIQPAPYKILNAIGAQTWQGEFQTASNSTSYRLIVHVSTTTATAYTMRFDNFAVGPDVGKNMGVPVTDWVSYTPTLTGSGSNPSLGSTGTISGMWRRVGDTMECTLYAVASGTGVTNGSGYYQFSIPSGYSIDGSKTKGTFGTAKILNASVTYYEGVVVYGTSTAVRLLVNNAGDLVGQNVPAANWLSAGDDFQVTFAVPITGWSSNTVMSSDAATNVVAASFTGTKASTTTLDQITLTKVVDTTNSTSGNTWVVPVSGTYKIIASGNISTGSVSVTDRTIKIYVDGVAVSANTSSQSFYSPITTNSTRNLIAGQVISFYAQAFTAAGSLDGFYASIERISGPAQIAASEVVAVEVSTTAGQSIPNNSATQITFGTTEGDSTGSWSSNTFTAPISGRYLVATNINYNANGTGLRTLEIQANGTTAAIIVMPTVTGVDFSLALTKSVRLLAGQTIKIYTQQTSGGNLALTTNTGRNTLSIVRTGNY